MIYAYVRFVATKGQRQKLLDAFAELRPKVLEEKGCVAYATSVDCRTEITRQLPLEPDVVTLIEQWESLEDLYAHGSASHMAEFREQNGKLILSSELRISEG